MKIQLPSPHVGQQAVIRDAKRFNVLSAGRRWRKTTLAMSLAVDAAVHGQSWIWGAPTFDQVRIGWQEMRRAAGQVAEFKQSTMTATFPGGGSIVFRSLDDPDNARGHTADGAVIDEAGDVAERAWYEVIRPMLIDTNGTAWLIGTPRGRNWFWREWMAAANRDDAMRWQIPTKGCRIEDGALIHVPHPLENPDIPFAEIQHIYETIPVDMFRQEIMAEFLEGEGTVFRNILACINAPATTPAEHVGHGIVIGCDWGKQQDYTAFSAVCRDCMCEVELDRTNRIDYVFQRQRLAALVAKWGAYAVLPERNSIGEPIIEELIRSGLPISPGPDGRPGFQTTAQTKPQLIESLALTLERAEMQWLNIPIATAELEAYERKASATTGRPTYSAPEGVHDDTVIARALARWAVGATGIEYIRMIA